MDEQPKHINWNDLSKREQKFMLYWYSRGRLVTYLETSKVAAGLVKKGLLSPTGLKEGRYIVRQMTTLGRWLVESETYAS
jgi:hypothetical protein